MTVYRAPCGRGVSAGLVELYEGAQGHVGVHGHQGAGLHIPQVDLLEPHLLHSNGLRVMGDSAPAYTGGLRGSLCTHQQPQVLGCGRLGLG